MSNIVNLFEHKPPKRKQQPNLHITEPGEYDLEALAVGISIALTVAPDDDAVKLFMEKFTYAVNTRQTYVEFTLEETRKYLDYLDVVRSPRNTELRIAYSVSICT